MTRWSAARRNCWPQISRGKIEALMSLTGTELPDFRAAAIASVVEGLADALSALIPLPLLTRLGHRPPLQSTVLEATPAPSRVL
jgi:hypothetical protein